MKLNKVISVSIGFLIFIILLGSAYIITQGHHGIMLRLGRLVEDSSTQKVEVLSPGLHFKIPFIDSVRIFDTRIQTMDIQSSRIVTKEKKDVIVDYYVKWRIQDLDHYFRSTGGNEFKAETLLEQQLNTLLRAEFGKRTISEVVSGGRDDLMVILQEHAEEQASELGMHVVDVRIKGIELPPNTSNAIYQRMRANMKKIAEKHRADGNAEAEAIQAAADAKAAVTIAKALSEGKTVRAKGQAEAASIYANAYSKDKEFFALYRSLKAYEASFNGRDDILVLDQSGAFFNYFKGGPQKKLGS